MNFVEAIESALKKYFVFSGRASRSEYWYFCLFYTGAVGVAALVDRLVFPDIYITKWLPIGYTEVVCYFALLTPGTSVWVRRLHDIGRSGWWCLIIFTIIGLIPILYWSLKKGDTGANRYGNEVTSQKPAQKNWPSIGLAFVAAVFALFPYFFSPPPTLIVAAQDGQRDIVIQMIEKGADVNEADLVGMTPLMTAVVMGHVDIVALLIEKGANFNDKGAFEMTPLVAATAQNRSDIVALLLKHGASVEDKDTGGYPAIDLAVQQGYSDIAEMLMKAVDGQ